MQKPRVDKDAIVSLAIGAVCSGIGVAFGSLHIADAGDALAFAGGLIGAGASVWGAFAVIDRSQRQQQDEAGELFRTIAQGVLDDMAWLLRLQDRAVGAEHFASVARRIDGIATGIPETAEFMRTERLGAKSGRISVLAADLRFRAALTAAAPSFERLAQKRREYRGRVGDLEDVSVGLMPAVLRELRAAADDALTNS